MGLPQLLPRLFLGLLQLRATPGGTGVLFAGQRVGGKVVVDARTI
jgi:hypothetical protein